MAKLNVSEIYAAKYTETDGVASYSGGKKLADTISIDLKFSWKRKKLYASGRVKENRGRNAGSTVAIGVDDLDLSAQEMLYGHTYTAATSGQNPTPESLLIKEGDVGDPLGIGFVADGSLENDDYFEAAVLYKVAFTNPGMVYKTSEEEIEYQTPTTTGEIDSDVSKQVELVTRHATHADAVDWVKSQLGIA